MMNERIKELADNATHYANGVCDADTTADWYETRDQKFAELIIRECVEIADRCAENGSWIAGYRIKQHFGVE